MIDAAVRWCAGPPPGWDEHVAGDPNAAPAHRPVVWRALAEALPEFSAHVIAVEGPRGLLGGAPVIVERRAGLEWLHALPWLLSGAPLAGDDARETVDLAVARALADAARDRGAVGGEWVLDRPAGPAVAPEAVMAIPGETRVLETARVDLAPGVEAAWRRVDRKTRQALSQARASLRFEEDPDALPAAYALHLAQSRRWRGHRPLPLELARRLLAGADACGPAARLFVVRDAGGVLAATLALDHPRETLVWWSGSHPEARERHAFPLLMWEVAAWAAAAGRARLHLGASAGLGPIAAFKQALGATAVPVPVRWLDARQAPPVARAVAAAQRWVRRGRHRGRAA